MNEKEVAEIRRHLKIEKSNINNIHGCYVNEKHEIVTTFKQSMRLMPEDEAEKFLTIFKKTLTGTLNKNLIDIEFSTEQVVNGEEHQLLSALRSTALEDGDLIRKFFDKVVNSLEFEGSYVIFLTYDVYDIPYRGKDGEVQADGSTDAFTHIICSICPVKERKPVLSYHVVENAFHNLSADWVVARPALGFMFPSFDDRSANIYNALYYTGNSAESYDTFVESIFNAEIPLPAAEQKEVFQTILADALDDECSYEVVETVYSQLTNMIEVHKENKEPTPLTVSKDQVKLVLNSCGVSKERLDEFDTQFEESFGAERGLSPKNLVDPKRFEITMPDVTVKVSPERSDLVNIQEIDGVKYVMIKVQDGLEVNGVEIQLSDKEKNE